nr:hypothetical protein [Mycobacterium sp. UM_NZ2]
MPDFTSVFTQERNHWQQRAEAAEAELARAQATISEMLDENNRLDAERDQLRTAHHAFTARLGFGDGITEPAAELDGIVEPIEAAFAEARDHQECPHLCESCGETLANTRCTECHGSGCGPGTALGAYDECEHCGGGGWVHEGCAERSYADLVAELARLHELIRRGLPHGKTHFNSPFAAGARVELRDAADMQRGGQ